MFNFSMYIDDRTAGDINRKAALCDGFRMNNMEINDCIEGRKIVDMNGEELEEIRNILIDNNKKIVLMCCSEPVTNTGYYKALLRKAHMLKVENLKVCMEFKLPDEENPAAHLKNICRVGKSYGIGVLVENHSNTCLATDKQMAEVYKAIKQENTGIIFNPLEYAKEKKHPFFHEFYNSKMKNEVRFLRVTDGLFVDGSPTMPGEGNAEIKELASILLARGYRGYFSFVPYFDGMGANRYKEVIARFKKMLKEM